MTGQTSPELHPSKSRMADQTEDDTVEEKVREANRYLRKSVLANRYLRKAFHYSNRKGFLLACGAPRFRALFRNLVDHFELEGLYAVYSLRRGGATWDFLMHNSMERTLLRGRWSSSSTARIYLQDTVATTSMLKLSPFQHHYARLLATSL